MGGEDFMDEINNQNFNQSFNQNFSVSLGLPDLKKLAGWVTFRAIIDIITGAAACLFIITAAYGVPLIISGTKLLKAASSMKRSIALNDYQNVSDTFYHLQSYFKLNGISIIIKMCFAVLIFILYVVLIVFSFTHSVNFSPNNNFGPIF
jgi:hypothetical protein